MKVRFLGIGVVVLCASTLSIAEDGDTDGLRECGLIDDASSRLACYDRLSGRPASTPTTGLIRDVTSPTPGGSDAQPAVVSVNRCVKDSRKRLVFYMENGDVWKQVDDKRLDFKECDFNVTISKVLFGYKMQKEGEEKRFRVSRVQ